MDQPPAPKNAQAAASLYERDLPEDYLDAWTALYAQPATLQEERASLAALVFRLGGEWLALPGAAVLEIAEPRPVHSLPHRRNGILLGLVNLNGQLEPCLSLHALLGVAQDAAAGRESQRTYPRLLLAGGAGRTFVLPVDEVLGIHRYGPGALREPPATLSHAAARYSRGLLAAAQRTVGLLDEQRLFQALERALT